MEPDELEQYAAQWDADAAAAQTALEQYAAEWDDLAQAAGNPLDTLKTEG